MPSKNIFNWVQILTLFENLWGIASFILLTIAIINMSIIFHLEQDMALFSKTVLRTLLSFSFPLDTVNFLLHFIF